MFHRDTHHSTMQSSTSASTMIPTSAAAAVAAVTGYSPTGSGRSSRRRQGSDRQSYNSTLVVDFECLRHLSMEKGICAVSHGCQMAIARFLDRMCLAFRASGLWLCNASLQNLIPSFPWIAPGWRAPHVLHPGLIQGKEGIKFCHLATLIWVVSPGVLTDD